MRAVISQGHKKQAHMDTSVCLRRINKCHIRTDVLLNI